MWYSVLMGLLFLCGGRGVRDTCLDYSVRGPFSWADSISSVGMSGWEEVLYMAHIIE